MSPAARALFALGLVGLITGCGAARSSERAAARDSHASADVTRELGCVSTAAEVCYNATDDNCNGVLDEGCGIETGPVQFMIAWEPALADVDLLVTDPAGELAEVGHPLASGLVKQRDCPGRNNECRGQSYENVFLEAAEAPHGTYTVRVMLESLGGENPPIHVRFGARVGPRTFGYALDLNLPHSLHDANFVW